MGDGFFFFLESTDSFDFLPLLLSFKESVFSASPVVGTFSPFIGNEQVRLSPVGTRSFLHGYSFGDGYWLIVGWGAADSV